MPIGAPRDVSAGAADNGLAGHATPFSLVLRVRLLGVVPGHWRYSVRHVGRSATAVAQPCRNLALVDLDLDRGHARSLRSMHLACSRRQVSAGREALRSGAQIADDVPRLLLSRATRTPASLCRHGAHRTGLSSPGSRLRDARSARRKQLSERGRSALSSIVPSERELGRSGDAWMSRKAAATAASPDMLKSPGVPPARPRTHDLSSARAGSSKDARGFGGLEW